MDGCGRMEIGGCVWVMDGWMDEEVWRWVDVKGLRWIDVKGW